ncbi:MAG: hypothetical protein U0X20_07215 [Caldilineaceae bacterium]
MAGSANGSNLRRVVENASSPALSADGTLLAYRPALAAFDDFAGSWSRTATGRTRCG